MLFNTVIVTIILSILYILPTNASTRHTKVVILGAGASGISAALTLQKKNITDFIIVDAQSFIGGRVQHKSFGGNTVELGANWIYGKGANPIYRLAKKHGLKTIPNDKKSLVYFNQEVGQLPTETCKKMSAFFDTTMETMVNFAGWAPDTPLKAAIEYFGVNWELAEPAEMSSLDYATGTVDTVSGSFPNGNDFVVTILTANGTTIIADHAICTFSLGVLQSQQVKFTPEFPEWKREAFNKTQYGGDYTVWQNLAAIPSSCADRHNNVLMVTTTFKESEQVEFKADEQVKREIHRVLQQMFPQYKVPFPSDILIPRWRQHHLFHGSYSNWPIGMSLQHHENMRAPLPLATPRLWFAGEAMSQKYYGYLHGAWLNGKEVAEIVGDCMGQYKCHQPYPYHPIVTGCDDRAAQRRRLRSSRFSSSFLRENKKEQEQHQNQNPFLHQ
ncbi:hypothetical protein BC941DRAFT_343285 [Chlamydoabsidia padenii]|nr:hypothetical protein BC941DRAFT_343285 [Chlamydoabsidia padenii]